MTYFFWFDYICILFCLKKKKKIIVNFNETIFLVIFILTGTLFLEFWKRKQATMQYKWDLLDYVREEVCNFLEDFYIDP